MKIQETILNATENYLIYKGEPYEPYFTTPSEAYKESQREYGRCVGKVYVDTVEGDAKHVGWVFQKKVNYERSDEKYLQEVWVTVYETHEVETIVHEEYAKL